MQELERKIWWWSITIPLKIKTLLYPFLNKGSGKALSAVAIDDLVLNKRTDYISYQYLGYSTSQLNDLAPIWHVHYLEGNYFNPIELAVSALASCNQPKEDNDNTVFLNSYNFLKNYSVWDKHNEAFWIPYYLDYPKYGMKAPWVSGLTQALCLSVALRAIPKDESFVRGLYRSLLVRTEEGGVFTCHPSSYPWIAEYPGKTPFVLNGLLSVLIGLLDYYNYSEEEEVLRLFLELLNGILSDYREYVFAKELRYSWNSKQLANIQYKGLHAFQLLHLYRLTGLKVFYQLAREWARVVNWKDFCYFHNILDKDSLIEYLKKELSSTI